MYWLPSALRLFFGSAAGFDSQTKSVPMNKESSGIFVFYTKIISRRCFDFAPPLPITSSYKLSVHTSHRRVDKSASKFESQTETSI